MAFNILISGSINSGKTTVGHLIATKLGWDFLDFDEISKEIPHFNLDKDIPKVIRRASEKIVNANSHGKSVVGVYVLRERDYGYLRNMIKNKHRFFILDPSLEVVLSNRGRELTKWEKDRIKYHYQTGIQSVKTGIVIDNSSQTPDETAEEIIDLSRPF